MKIHFQCNGEKVVLDADPGERALDLLRDRLELTGVKEGCGKGECGACTILLNGKPVNSCLLFAPKLDGAVVETIEGLSNGEKLHPIQESFLEEGAVQCGFCTPGMILSTKCLLENNPDPDEGDIEEALSGNICRCTGYEKIVHAVKNAADKINQKNGKRNEG